MHEIINTQTCRLCGALHTYRLEMETTPHPRTLGKSPHARRRTFAGRFRCPVRDEDFRGSATVLAPEGEEVVGMRVVAVES